MEAFEQFVAVAMQVDGFVVSGATKFPVQRRTKKKAYVEYQTHGYEVDLVGANSKQLVLATVKSFFGSHGVRHSDVMGTGPGAGGYRLLNDFEIRSGVMTAAAARYGYSYDQVALRLYVGKFVSEGDERVIRAWCKTMKFPSGPIQVFNVKEVVTQVMEAASRRGYVDDASIVALKVLNAAGVITLPNSPPVLEVE